VTILLNRKLSFVLVAVMLLSFAVGVAAQDRKGTWVNDVIFVEEASVSTAVSRLQAGDIDIWANSSSDLTSFNTVKADPALKYYESFGSYTEVTYNTVGPTFSDGRLNPLGNRKIREATNMLFDRDYIAQELYGGLAVPKYTLLNNSFVDYSRVVEKIRELELKYAYNPEKAKEIISAEMVDMGATLVNGVWHHNGSPVTIKIIARSEDERAALGNYMVQQFEAMGFVATVDYRTSSEASPIWMMGDPAKGEWNAYTGGWLSPMVYRDQGHIFNQMYTKRTMTQPRWQALEPIPELDEVSDKLYNKQYTSMEERRVLYERALELAFEDSPCVFIVDQISFTPVREGISIASDLAGYVAGTGLWPVTLRRENEIGGTVNIALPQVLVEPWNAVAGSNWTMDMMPIRATFDRGYITDPYTGNYWAHRIEKAEVVAKEGLPIGKTLDWVDLDFASEIKVPGDAWAKWDPVAQKFLTVDEVYPEGLTATRMSRMYYTDVYNDVTWHDGSKWHIVDALLPFIMDIDRGYPESPFYDKSAEAGLQTFLNSFRGLKIISVDPLVYEMYSDSWSLDAEYNISDLFAVHFNYGKQPWHTLAIGMYADAAGEIAFSASKASELNVEWLGFQGGPSMPILAKQLDKVLADGSIPYAEFLSQFITKDEIVARYANAKAWYQAKGHFWIGDGPMYLERAYPTERMVHLKRFEGYSEPADKWAMFEEPMIAEVAVSGPARVSAGSAAEFSVAVTFKGEAYALENIQDVKFIVLDSTGKVAVSGQGTGVADGEFVVTLTAEQTKSLPVGSNTLEVIVLPTLVGGASIGSQTFITLP
jgi:peptide/nickel transport system substrate-binding protein